MWPPFDNFFPNRWLGAFLYITGSFTFGSTAGMFVDQLRNPGRPLRALWSNPGTDHTTVRAGMWSSATAMAHSSAALAHKASAKSERFVVHTVIYRNAPSLTVPCAPRRAKRAEIFFEHFPDIGKRLAGGGIFLLDIGKWLAGSNPHFPTLSDDL